MGRQLKTVYTYNNLNKRLYYWGLSGPQLLRITAILLLTYIAIFLVAMIIWNGLYAAVILVILALGSFLPVSRRVKKIREENKRGNPDYMASLKIERYSPGYLVDRSFVMSVLNSKKDNN